MKKLLKTSTILIATMLITYSCTEDTKSKDRLSLEQKTSVKSSPLRYPYQVGIGFFDNAWVFYALKGRV
jgi:hypothetical protein